MLTRIFKNWKELIQLVKSGEFITNKMFSKQKDIQLEFKQIFQNNFNSAKNAKKNEQERFASGVANTKPKNFKKQD